MILIPYIIFINIIILGLQCKALTPRTTAWARPCPPCRTCPPRWECPGGCPSAWAEGCPRTPSRGATSSPSRGAPGPGARGAPWTPNPTGDHIHTPNLLIGSRIQTNNGQFKEIYLKKNIYHYFRWKMFKQIVE